jgi:hypothetical protein
LDQRRQLGEARHRWAGTLAVRGPGQHDEAGEPEHREELERGALADAEAPPDRQLEAGDQRPEDVAAENGATPGAFRNPGGDAGDVVQGR